QVHQKYGKPPWADVVRPSIALARDGHRLDEFHAKDMGWVTSSVAKYLEGDGKSNPALERALKATAAAFTRPDGSAHEAGDLWRQPDLAATLERIATEGPK